MESIRLTDSEVAVTLDSLAMTRDRLKADGMETPNIESALAKLHSLMTPSTNGLTVAR